MNEGLIQARQIFKFSLAKKGKFAYNENQDIVFQNCITTKRSVYMQEDTKRLNVIISNDLHRELKVEVAKQGITIAQFVSEAIAEKIERQKGDKS